MKTLQKIVNNIDLKGTLINIGAAGVAGTFANLASNSFLGYNLNKYNSVGHFTGGVGLGTLAYTGFGKGRKGVTAGLAFATLANIAWEVFENRYVFKTDLISRDTMVDVVVVYGGAIASFVGEKMKEIRKKRWVL